MGKRSDFNEKRPRDLWPTVDPAAIPIAFYNKLRGKTYAEPCYGEGDLEDLLMEVAICKWRSDIHVPEGIGARQIDALSILKTDLYGIDCIITNPPYDWKMLQPLLDYYLNVPHANCTPRMFPHRFPTHKALRECHTTS